MTEAAETAEETAPETVEDATPAPEEQAAPDPYEAKLASLKSQSKGLQRELAKRDGRARELEQELASIKEQLATNSLDSLKDLPPLERAKRIGLDYGSLTADLLKGNEPPETEEQAAVRELREWKEQQETERAEREAAAKTEAEQAQETKLVDTINAVLQQREDTPTLAALDGGKMVLDKMRAWCTKNHQDTPPEDVQEEIALEVERSVHKQVRGQLESLVKADKTGAFREMLSKLTAVSNDTEQSDEQAIKSRKGRADSPASRTLTNRIASNPGDRKPPPAATREDRRQRAIQRAGEIEQELQRQRA